MRAGLLALAVLLAGCTTPAATLSGEGLVNASGLVQMAPECGAEGILKVVVQGTAGAIEATVTDGAGATIADRVRFAGDHDGEMDLGGAAGTWKVELRQIGFTGDYSLELDC
ncbi:MAG: hypothetical protein QOD77_1743 [Thermoplasmata archaeon]|jgi:hypothetical protein|nr:hypothetical protein [Thermoplasmata archaeon]